jgi:AraC family transcriptional regulator of adaptative response/methylated-DNA-[protein]-cysteine methyltransferase
MKTRDSVHVARSTIRYGTARTQLGTVLAAASDEGLVAIMLGGDADAMELELLHRFPGASRARSDAAFDERLQKIARFVEHPREGLDERLDVQGTDFQKRVWNALQAIPAGETASYLDIARHIGSPKAVRAVAQACGANHLAVVIPCHRVVRNDGAISGYRWGVDRKRELLHRESKKGSE